MKCKRCKFWDNGYCKEIWLGVEYDGYLETGKNFGCIFYKKGKYQSIIKQPMDYLVEDISNREKEQEVNYLRVNS